MRVLLITPGLNKVYNDNAYAYSHMSSKGVKICVISNQTRKTKGHGISQKFENIDGIEIHRPYMDFREQSSPVIRRFPQIRKIVQRFKPDAILCSQQKNMFLALRIQREFGIPILLLVEFAYDRQNPFRLIYKERYIKNKNIGTFFAYIYWKWLSRKANAIITCSPNDAQNMDELTKINKNVYYVPWPSYPTYNPNYNRPKIDRGIFIGALDRHKNIQEFYETLPKIFENTRIKKFFIVGNGKYIHIVNNLKNDFPGMIEHIPKVERKEALRMIAESYFAYVPAKFGSWGFIVDCWAMKTPLITTTNHYKFNNRIDSLVCNKSDIDLCVNLLAGDKKLYHSIQKKGYERFNNDHHAHNIGDRYINILKNVLLYKKKQKAIKRLN